ncbi:MAG TPA: hypothetical protein VIJ55_02550 [Acetobacteraceae bacterium]
MSGSTFTVGTQADLNNAIETLDGETAPDTYTVTLSSDIVEGEAGQPPGLFILTLQPGVDVGDRRCRPRDRRRRHGRRDRGHDGARVDRQPDLRRHGRDRR